MKKFPISLWYSGLKMVWGNANVTRGFAIHYVGNQIPAYCLIVDRAGLQLPQHHFLANALGTSVGDADLRIDRLTGPPTHDVLWFDTILTYELAMEQYSAVMNGFSCNEYLRHHLFEYAIVIYGAAPHSNAHHLEIIQDLMDTFAVHLSVIETKRDCHKFMDILLEHVGDRVKSSATYEILSEYYRAKKKYDYAIDRMKRELGDDWREYCMTTWGMEYENDLDSLLK